LPTAALELFSSTPTTWPRLDKEPTLSFATADLCDSHEDQIRSGQLRIVAPMFRAFGGRPTFSGPIATLKLFEDNSFVRKTLEQPGNGRVLVIDGGGSLRRALVGDQLAALGVRNGWGGIVAYGCVRDSAAIATMDIGVLALASHPQKTDKKDVGEIDIAVTFGGVTFKPGEWLYADADGILVASKRLT
jgi:regulator of ribonuclease activity A